MSLVLVPTTLREANAFVEQHHRHHKPARGCICVVAVAEPREVVPPRKAHWAAESELVIAGVAIIGRPVARHLQDGFTAEVTRLCTDGTRNACSKLYAAAWRACRALGYRRLVTYTLPQEGGASLRAAGWTLVGSTGEKRGWTRPKRPRADEHPLQEKLRWEVAA